MSEQAKNEELKRIYGSMLDELEDNFEVHKNYILGAMKTYVEFMEAKQKIECRLEELEYEDDEPDCES